MLGCVAVGIVSVRDYSFHSGAMIQKGSGDEACVQFSISRGFTLLVTASSPNLTRLLHNTTSYAG